MGYLILIKIIHLKSEDKSHTICTQEDVKKDILQQIDVVLIFQVLILYNSA